MPDVTFFIVVSSAILLGVIMLNVLALKLLCKKLFRKIICVLNGKYVNIETSGLLYGISQNYVFGS